MSEVLGEIARALGRARHGVVLTGAGVSTECGIPDFRSDRGVWARADPMEVGSIHGFRESPGRFYRFWGDFFAGIGNVQPGSTHHLLAALERAGHVKAVITQNIDGLHQRAGSRVVHEVHGAWETARCLRCGRAYETRAIVAERDLAVAATCEVCGGLVKPDVVLFGEPLGPAFERAKEDVERADVFVVFGSSLEVAPVSELVPLAASRGVTVCIVNRDETPHDDEARFVAHVELKEAAAKISAELGLR